MKILLLVISGLRNSYLKSFIMNWWMFAGGIATLIYAYDQRQSSIGMYGKDGEEKDEYDLRQKVVAKFGAVMWAIFGVFLILISFIANK